MLIGKINPIYIEVNYSYDITLDKSKMTGGKVVIYCYYLYELDSGFTRLICVPLK